MKYLIKKIIHRLENESLIVTIKGRLDGATSPKADEFIKERLKGNTNRLLGNKSFGLANILRENFGHESNKRLQRSDWTRRPLSAEQISWTRASDSDGVKPPVRMAWRRLTPSISSSTRMSSS